MFDSFQWIDSFEWFIESFKWIELLKWINHENSKWFRESVCGVLRIILCSEIKYALNVLDLAVFVFLVVVFNESV